MKLDSKDILFDFIEANPRCNRKMLIAATGIEKSTLGKHLRIMKPMLTIEIELDSRNRPVEHYTINPHYDKQKVVIKQFEPINVKHHPLHSAFWGVRA